MGKHPPLMGNDEAYRFFSNRRVQARNIFEAHAASTMERVKGRRVVLAAQDTTYFNFTSHPRTSGLGPIGAHNTKQRGFLMHSAMAVDADNGAPLGLMGAVLWSRAAAAPNEKKTRSAPSPQEKESARWLKMLRHVTAGVPAGTEVVAVSDRESDTIEYLQLAVTGGHKVLVRATHDRKLATAEEQRLWQAVEATDLLGLVSVTVRRADDRPARRAIVALQATTVIIAPPSGKRALGPVKVTGLLAREADCPEGQTPLHWLLLTTLPVATVDDAARCLRWYTYRWRIERFHFVLKSGCRVEELQLTEAARIQRALAAFAVVAWRVLALTYAAREHPEEPCTRFLGADEWRALACFVQKTPEPPSTPPDLHTAVRWIANLGGFIGRKSDGEPGVKVLWRGLRRLPDITDMWRIMRQRQ